MDYKNTKTKSNFRLLIICFIFIVVILIIIIVNSKSVTVPNVVGMTANEVKIAIQDLNLELVVLDIHERKVNDNNAIVISQFWNAGEHLREGDIFPIYVNSDENERIDQIENVIKEFAEEKRNEYSGSVKFNDYKVYDTTQNGEIVYKIRYNTSSKAMILYQLVSLNADNTAINKSSRLFQFTILSTGSEKGEELELKYAYEKLWDK